MHAHSRPSLCFSLFDWMQKNCKSSWNENNWRLCLPRWLLITFKIWNTNKLAEVTTYTVQHTHFETILTYYLTSEYFIFVIISTFYTWGLFSLFFLSTPLSLTLHRFFRIFKTLNYVFWIIKIPKFTSFLYSTWKKFCWWLKLKLKFKSNSQIFTVHFIWWFGLIFAIIM